MKNNGIFISSNNSESSKTIIVLGVARSGTSMAAIVLHHLGVDMGVNESDIVYERHEVFGRLESNHIDSFKSLVQDLNEKHQLWGWKRPKSIEYVDRFESIVRNPHYVVPFRDYMAIASRNAIAVNVDTLKNLAATHKHQYSQVVDFVEHCKKPMFLFSYEKAIQDPKEFVTQMAGFVGVKDPEKINAAVKAIEPNAKKYVENNVANPKTQSLIGRLDRVSNGEIRGWAKNPQINEAINVDLFINDQFTESILADKERSDLAGHGDHAFFIDIKKFSFHPTKVYKISIRDKEGKELNNSPITYVHA